MKTQYIPPCPAICESCAENPKHADEEVIISFCEHRGYGGILTLESGQWAVMGPYEDDESFRRALGFALMQKLAQKTAAH